MSPGDENLTKNRSRCRTEGKIRNTPNTNIILTFPRYRSLILKSVFLTNLKSLMSNV